MTDIFPTGSRICGYVRDSGGRDQDLSTIQQRESIGKWCAEQGLILSRVYEDAARSGASIVGRGQFLAMIDYLSNDVPEKGIVLWEFARLSRDYNDLMYYVSDLKRQGYIIHSISDAVPEGLEGSLLLGVKAYANAKFLQDLRRNVRRGLHYVVRNHQAHIATVPVGYKKEQEIIGRHRDGSPHIISHLVIDESTAPLVKRAFEMRAVGATYKEIHEQLRLYNWHLSYKRLFSNSVYIGVKHFGGEVIDSFCEPLIDIDTWKAVQKVQADRKARHGYNHPRAIRSRFWLTGILYCAKCGRPMHGHMMHKKGEKPYEYYICTSKVTFEPCESKPIRKDKLERRILEILHDVINNKDILNDVYEEAQAQESALDGERDILCQRNMQELKSTEQAISRLLAAIREAGHSRAMLEELSNLEQHQLELQQSIAQLDIQPDVKLNISLDDIIGNIQQALDIANEQQRGILVRGFIKRIEAEKNNGIVTGKIYVAVGAGETVIPLMASPLDA